MAQHNHSVKQFSHLKGGPKDLPAAPLDYLPADGEADGKRSPTPGSKGITRHATRQSHGSRKLSGGY